MENHPDRTQILERLRRVVPEKVDVDPELLKPGAVLADIGIDSFALIELVFVAEEEFSIKIPLEGIKVHTVDDVLDVVLQRIGAPA